MQKKRLLWLVIGLVAMAEGAVLVYDRQREPEFRGKKLSEWLDLLPPRDRTPPPDAEDAIRHIGRAAVPSLLNWMTYDPSTLTSVFTDEEEMVEKLTRAAQALYAFRILGTNAACAIPALKRFIDLPGNEGSAMGAIKALGYIGRPALPVLEGVLTNHYPGHMRSDAAEAIGRMETNGRPAIPLLLKCINDPDQRVESEALWALGRMKLEPSILAPILMRRLEHTNAVTRSRTIDLVLKMGANESSPRPHLQNLLTNESYVVRELATNTMRSVATNPPRLRRRQAPPRVPQTNSQPERP